MYDGALLYVVFLVLTQTEDDVYDLGFDLKVCLWFYSDGATDKTLICDLLYMVGDSAIGRCLVHGLLCLV